MRTITTNNDDLIVKAQQFAHRAHDNIRQVRKYTGEPYWTHTDAVARMVSWVEDNPHVIAAAHLHDIFEDVIDKVDGAYEFRKEFDNLFGEWVVWYVQQLTDLFTPDQFPQFSRKRRKMLEAERYAKIAPQAATIKLADIIHNINTIYRHDKTGFVFIYLLEKKYALKHLQHGNKWLLILAWLTYFKAQFFLLMRRISSKIFLDKNGNDSYNGKYA